MIVTTGITVRRIYLMAGSTKLIKGQGIPVLPIRCYRYSDPIFSVDTGSEEKRIWAPVGFVAIGAGKDPVIVIRVRVFEMSFSILRPTMSSSM